MEKSRIWHNGVPGIISSWTSARPKRSDYRRARKTEHSPLCIYGKAVERIDSIKFLGVHISFDRSRTADKSQLAKKAQQWFFFLRKLKQTRLSSQLVTNFYRAKPKASCVSVWQCGTAAAEDCGLPFTRSGLSLPKITPPPINWDLHQAALYVFYLNDH